MGGVGLRFREWTPFAAMVMIECFDVGLTTLAKAAMSKGMNHFVFVVYSNALATLILLPSSFFINNTSRRTTPPLSFNLLCMFFLLGLLGITSMQNCAFIGVNYSSPTLASAMSNLTPAITFVLAVIFRMEKLNIGSPISQVKVLGAVLSISGALVVTLYKGISVSFSRIQPSQSHSQQLLGESSNWVLGGLFFATASLSLALWNITQAAILKGYSFQFTILAYYCLFGTIQSSILSLIVVRDPHDWIISPDIELISILYSGILGSVVTFSVMTWCIERKGPVFVSLFKPIGIAISSLSSVVFLGETLHLGRIIGAVIIAFGFYTVMWAQSKEEKAKGLEVDTQSPLSAEASPLLESHESNNAA